MATSGGIIAGVMDSFSLLGSANSDMSDSDLKAQGNGSLLLNSGLQSLTGYGWGDIAVGARGMGLFGGSRPDKADTKPDPLEDATKKAGALAAPTPPPGSHAEQDDDGVTRMYTNAPTSIPSVPSGAAQLALPQPPTSSGSSLEQLQDEADPYRDQLISLKRQKSDLKGKSNKEQREGLQDQIEAMQDQQRAWKDGHSQQMRDARRQEASDKAAAKLAEKDAKEDEREQEKAAREMAKGGHPSKSERGAASLSKEGKGTKGDENAALRRYLENGGDVNQWKDPKDGGDIAGVSRGTSGGGSSSITVPMPRATASRVDGGKIRIDFTAPAPVFVDDPLARHLDQY